MNTTLLIAIAIAGIAGVGIGYALRRLILLSQKSTLELEIKEKRLAAKEEASQIKEKAEEQAEKIKVDAKNKAEKEAEEIATKEKAVVQKQASLEEKEQYLTQKEQSLEERRADLEEKETNIKRKKKELQTELSRIANMSPQEAREQLISEMEDQFADEIQARRKKLERNGEKTLERRGKELLSGVLQRLSRSVDPEILSTKVTLEDDDLKGKIIGKNGRNIRTFQQETGVELIIDETPKVITISCYDPVRRAVAKHALDDLLKDGRVQPARIERFVADAKEHVNHIIKDKGEAAAEELNLLSLDDRIIAMLGRLHFRTSYGQNVLQHSIEAAHIAEMLAHELSLDTKVAKTAALLHDIGKAADHELSGSHVEIGIHILTKFGADQAIINAMKSHHDDYPHESLEAVIVQVADGVSGARPGARKQSIESYVERLEELENIAGKINGVVNSYAIEAGREVRVFVNSEKIDDSTAKSIARQIATKIENRVNYPGEVKIHVIRETRLTHYAR